MIIKNGLVFTPEGTFEKKDLYIEGEYISNKTTDNKEVEAEGCYVIPGLVDIHFHGCVRHDMCDGTEESIQALADYEAANGVLAICPATMTIPEDQLMQAMKAAKEHKTVKISAGYRLSYPDERLFTFYLDEFETKLFDLPEGVYTCLIENEDCEEQILTPGMDDEIFSRTKVPMTKNEVRVLSISRLELTKKAVVYDVGSGTGSVSVECARLSPDIAVFAIEQKEEAANLTKENAVRLGLSDQIMVINKKAPEGFEELPTPTHVFIGGSSGALSDILSAIQKKLIVKENTKGVRVVINAVSLETIAQITKLIQTYPVKHVQLTQIQASRAHKLGSYNLMQAQNPVLIASFNLLPDDKMEADE